MLRVLTSHYDPTHEPMEETKTSESVNLGFVTEPSRFVKFMDEISRLLKEKCSVVLPQRELKDFAKMEWKKLVLECGFNFR